jgi:Xaa-Pro aminopeptidase
VRLITRFEGSAGTAIIPSSAIDADALLFVDSRYWIQAEKQVPKAGWKVVRVGNSGGSGSVSVEKGWTEWVIDVSRFHPLLHYLMS